MAWPHSTNLSQGWHDCLHASPSFAGFYDEATNTTRCAGRLYFMPNDSDALLTRYLADFPQDEPANGELLLTHRDLPDAPLVIQDAVEGMHSTPWGALQATFDILNELRSADWIRPYGEFVNLYVTIRNVGDEDIPIGTPVPLREVPEGPWQLQSSDGSQMTYSTDDGWAAGIAMHVADEVLPPGAEATIRARIRIAKCSAKDMSTLLDADIAQWQAATPFSLPLPEPPYAD